VVGGSPVLERLMWATGHHRHGILLTPITAELVVAELAGRPLPELAEPASPERFLHPAAHVEVVR
jgi:glycine oxidase